MKRQRILGPDDSRAPVRRGSHGLTADALDAMRARQGGRCAICLRSGPRLVIDHDHRHCPGKTGCPLCVRGLLCIRCNVALGKLEARGPLRVIIYLGGRI